MDIVFKLDKIEEAALQLVHIAGAKKIVAMHGQMGAGKTTLVHAVCNVLGVKDMVSSPTFSIINEYTTAAGDSIYHLDLYRLNGEKEALDAGVEECIFSNQWCFVEWPENAPSLFPADAIHCYLSVTGDNERKLVVS